MSLYMLYGGTNWGGLAAPVVATSYDYSSPISESRALTTKYAETKLVGMFFRAARDLTVTEWIGNGTNYTTNAMISATELRNPDTGAGFYFTIHDNSTITTREEFKLTVDTSVGKFRIPRHASSIVLDGPQSKAIVTDFKFGSTHVLYSTAEILSTSTVGDRDTLVLWVPTGEAVEFSIYGAEQGSMLRCEGCESYDIIQGRQQLSVVIPSKGRGMAVATIDDNLTVIILDRSFAYTMWAPTLSADPAAETNDTVIVRGPYLVRSAAINGSTIAVTGDLDATTTIEVWPPRNVTKLSWNGGNVNIQFTDYGSLIAILQGPTSNITLPALTSWKVADSLPERLPSYDDSWWTSANHTSTPNPYPPQTLPVLYIDEYGYHIGTHLWRGHFTGGASGVYLNVTGGIAFGFSAYLNGDFIGSYLGAPGIGTGALELSFSNATVHTEDGADNVLLVIQDNHGHDEVAQAILPRGISNATLLG